MLLFENGCARCQFGCLAQSFDHATGLGDALTGDIEGGSVVDGGADDRQPDGDVDARFDAEDLYGAVALVVVHGHDQVVVAAAGEEEGGVGGQRPVCVDAVGDQCFTAGTILWSSSP